MGWLNKGWHKKNLGKPGKFHKKKPQPKSISHFF